MVILVVKVVDIATTTISIIITTSIIEVQRRLLVVSEYQ